jgi:hypothetical protein
MTGARPYRRVRTGASVPARPYLRVRAGAARNHFAPRRFSLASLIQRTGEIMATRQQPVEETIMASISQALPVPAPFARSFAVAALMGATVLAGSWTAARADTIGNAALQLAQATAPSNAPDATPAPTMPQTTHDQAQAAAGAIQGKSETVDQRITNLHEALKITPAEDSKWNAVAQAMRENAEAMDKLATEARAKPPRDLTALEDLKMYQRFAEAHVTGLRKLIASFSALYTAMPEAQKKTADQVFAASREARQQADQTQNGSHS